MVCVCVAGGGWNQWELMGSIGRLSDIRWFVLAEIARALTLLSFCVNCQRLALSFTTIIYILDRGTFWLAFFAGFCQLRVLFKEDVCISRISYIYCTYISTQKDEGKFTGFMCRKNRDGRGGSRKRKLLNGCKGFRKLLSNYAILLVGRV